VIDSARIRFSIADQMSRIRKPQFRKHLDVGSSASEANPKTSQH
jgi:hypothetical protein